MMDIGGIMLGRENAVLTNNNKVMQTSVIPWPKSPEEKRAEQLRKKALAAAIRRANETPEQTAERRRKNRERQRRNRAETLRKSLAIHTGSERFEATKIKSITEEGNSGTNGVQSYICIACKAVYENPVKYFDHIQRQCLKFYLEQPEVFSKILALVKSKMKEIRQAERSSKEENKAIEQKCTMCGDNFLFFTASALRVSESLCPTCRLLQRDVKISSQSIPPHSRIPKEIKFEGEISKRSSTECNTTSVTGRSNIKDSFPNKEVGNDRSANRDLIEGAIPPKRPLLTCETALPSYVWPSQMPYPLKAVRLRYSKNEPYKRHHCWECDSPILPTSKRFIDHFKMMYECQWCIYTTHCHQASIDHVMRMHASEEAMQETKHNPEVDIGVDPHSLQPQNRDDNLPVPMIKLEPPDLDEDFFPELNQNDLGTGKEASPIEDTNENNKEIVPMPPVNLRCLEITATTLLLQWDPPSEGTVTSYAMLFQGSGAPSQQLLPPERTLIRLAGLTPDTLYVVRVYTVNRHVFSQYATLFRKTSKVDESAYASEVVGVSCSILQNGTAYRESIKNASKYQHDEFASSANVNNLVDLYDRFISNVKLEVTDGSSDV